MPDTRMRSNAPAPVTPVPNPKRVVAGKANRAKRQGLTPEGHERLRQAALRHRPWRFATGPRTASGKAKVAENGRARQQGPLSVRQVRALLADIHQLARALREARQALRTGAAEGAP